MNACLSDKRWLQAQRLHGIGQFAAAEALYRELLDSYPKNTALICMLGVLLCATGRNEQGLALLERAAQLTPQDAGVQFNLACALEQVGRFADAVGCFARVVQAAPQDAEANFRLANALLNADHPAQAQRYYRRAIDLRPQEADWHNALGVACKLSGDLLDAISAYQASLRLKPSSAKSHYNLGIALQDMGRLDDALFHYQQAASLTPEDAGVLNNWGHLLRQMGQLETAHDVLQRAIELHPRHPGVLLNFANVLVDLNRVPESLSYYREALDRAPSAADAHASYAMALWLMGEHDAAVASCRDTLLLEAQHPDARFCLGLHDLSHGRFAEGWQGYEFRWHTRATGTRMRTFSRAAWQGESLAGKRLLIHAEQGVGDEIMFASLFPELIQEAEHCTIECTPKLAALFTRSFPQAGIVCTDRTTAEWAVESVRQLERQAKADFQSPAGGLPRFRRRCRAEFPAHSGYLYADAASIAAWRARLAQLGTGLKIGISWRGGTPRTGVVRRSLRLHDLLPILKTPNTRFVSLQYTPCSQELQAFEATTGIAISHWQEAIDDYDQSAALVCALDLVISVCTSIVHLAGALNKPVWVMAPAVPEWRYGVRTEEMPWYPSARIFRQQTVDNWSTVLNAVANELAFGEWRAATVTGVTA